MSTFSLQQQVFTLSMLSCGVSGQRNSAGRLELVLAGFIDQDFANQAWIDLIGNWTRVWGPVVWQDVASTVADNTMFVGHNSDENVYVVAIAGTNFVSTYDWKTEDFLVQKLVPWTYGAGGDTAQISTGTSDGLSVLLGMQDPQTNLTLSAFLEQVPDKSTSKLIFTGHSLGGALAPALALSLVNQLAQNGWEQSNILVYPTAGPTPGNQAFANLFQEAFPTPSNPPGFNQMVWNSIDVVPHAWDSTTFTASVLEKLYPPITASTCVKSLAWILTVYEDPLSKDYVQLPNNSFNGAYEAPAARISDQTCAYLGQVLYQHTVAYYNQLAPELLQQGLFTPYDPLHGSEDDFVNNLYPKLLAALQGQDLCKGN